MLLPPNPHPASVRLSQALEWPSVKHAAQDDRLMLPGERCAACARREPSSQMLKYRSQDLKQDDAVLPYTGCSRQRANPKPERLCDDSGHGLRCLMVTSSSVRHIHSDALGSSAEAGSCKPCLPQSRHSACGSLARGRSACRHVPALPTDPGKVCQCPRML